MSGDTPRPTVLCSVCSTELRMIPETASSGFGFCKKCDCWQPGVW